MRRQVAHGALAALIVVGLLATATGPVVAGDTQLRFADGTWQGSLVYTGQLSFEGGSASGGGSGALALTVNAGTVATGTFTFSGASSGSTTGGTASATANVEGIVDGPGAKPVLRGQSGSFDGVASSQGFEVPFSFPIGPADMTPAPLNIDAASCTLVTGDFVQAFAAQLSAQGISNSLYGRFSAVRTGDAPFPQQPEVIMAELIAQAAELAQQALTTGLDTDRLIMVVEQAEDFSASLPKNTECGFIEDAGAFNLVITSVISDLLELVTQDSTKFTTAQLAELLTIGLRVGAVGEGALNTAKSDNIIGNFKDVFSDRLDAALTSGDEQEIKDILLVAVMFGWESLVSKATGAL